MCNNYKVNLISLKHFKIADRDLDECYRIQKWPKVIVSCCSINPI